METLVKADIFFFIASIALVLITIVIIVAGYFVIKTIRDVRETIHSIKEEATLIIEDVDELRENVKAKLQSTASLIGAITSTAFIRKALKGVKRRAKNIKK